MSNAYIFKYRSNIGRNKADWHRLFHTKIFVEERSLNFHFHIAAHIPSFHKETNKADNMSYYNNCKELECRCDLYINKSKILKFSFHFLPIMVEMCAVSDAKFNLIRFYIDKFFLEFYVSNFPAMAWSEIDYNLKSSLFKRI